ncbi:hypothetical protein BGZ63DRAFT_399321 [Mariannaea sp. PMI_226]|nr:hypothetical protein BGZ63DRAFT_399321 [Mariannaea sp. PMI_226]
MGCLSHRRKQTENFPDQKWDYIHLNDFKSKGCGAIFAYIYLWLMLFISIAVYAVDSFTAVNLLAFNRWSSGIDPAIDINISKWIFSSCIILSFVNLAYEGWRAIRVMKRGNVAESYLDSLAVRWESIRIFGNGQGFRRFLVFAELTKSKKGAEYIALFTYFSFKSWIRVIICSGPRQVVNAFTIKAVYESKLAANSKTVEGSITGFFEKIKALAEEDYRQALTLSGMCFTLLVWVFSALFLIAAVLFWVFFLWHWIPSSDGGLSGYCERKVTQTLMKIVTKTVNKALAKQEAGRLRAEFKDARKNGEKPLMNRVATLPTLPNVAPIGNDKLPTMPTPIRTETMTTLPAYSSQPGTPGAMEMNNMEKRRPPPSRSATGMTNATYSSRTPLVSNASEMGYGRPPSPQPHLPDLDFGDYRQSPTTMANTPVNYPQQPPRPMLSNLGQNRFTETPAPMHSETMPYGPPSRAPTARTMDEFSQPTGSFNSLPPRAPTGRPVDGFSLPNEPSRSTPTPTAPVKAYQTYNPDDRVGQTQSDNSYWDEQPRHMNPPLRSVTGPIQPRGPQHPPQRNMTAPVPTLPSVGDYGERSSTPSSANFPVSRPAPPSAMGMRASPAPRLGPSPGTDGQSYGYSSYGYDTESQRGRDNWN